MPLFSARNVCFKGIVQYPDIDIEEGRATFISGESGCGKSSLLRLISGVTSPDAGEITYRGKPVADYDPVGLRREVLLCSQASYLFDTDVDENFAKYYGYRDLPAPTPEQIRPYLGVCAFDMPGNTPCHTMSGGERQRVFTAICLSLRPKVLMMDEPTSALDDTTANKMLSNIKIFCAEHGITLIVVSHNAALVQAYADDIITLGVCLQTITAGRAQA